MTPGARVAAAITILDRIIAGEHAERALSNWARQSRYAGSKDRAAIRDHVFDALRAKRSLGGVDGRALMIGLLSRDGWTLDQIFTGAAYHPDPLGSADTVAFATEDPAACDIPDWLWPEWQASLGQDAGKVARALQGRAPVFLRVNSAKSTPDQAAECLAQEEIDVQAHPIVSGCLRVTKNARRLRNARAYREGLVELQDAASQAAVAAVPIRPGAKVLDFCAGGGGKALAFASQADLQVFAHDIAPARMKDLPARAERAGATIRQLSTAAIGATGPFDVVFCDAPCSGSGAWRRNPEGKWRLSRDGLQTYISTQQDVIAQAATHVSQGGILAYATCSVLVPENTGVVHEFLKAAPSWRVLSQNQWLPGQNGDGFFVAILCNAH